VNGYGRITSSDRFNPLERRNDMVGAFSKLLKRRMTTSLLQVPFLVFTIHLAAVSVSYARLSTRVLSLEPGENNLFSAVVDADNGFAYFGTNTAPCFIIKVRLADFSRVTALPIPSVTSCGLLNNALIDPAHGFAYFTIGNINPGSVLKIQLSDFTLAGILRLSSGQPFSAIIDTANGFAYFGTTPGSLDQGEIHKVDLFSFSEVEVIQLDHGEYPNSAVIDAASGFAYFGIEASPGREASPGIIVKVGLPDFAIVDRLQLDVDENNPDSAVIDTQNGFAYFGTSLPPNVVKIGLSDFSRVGRVRRKPLLNKNKALGSAVIDTVRGLAYFGTQTCPRVGTVLAVRLSDFTVVARRQLVGGFGSAAIDPLSGFAYFGTIICRQSSTEQGQVVRVRLED
jgi:hypothetical protein